MGPSSTFPAGSSAIVVPDTSTIPWTWGGSTGTVGFKVLRTDGATRRLTRLVSFPAGWQSAAKAHYKDCEEGRFLIAGDLAADELKRVTALSYRFRPARVVHGPSETSLSGALCVGHYAPPDQVHESASGRPAGYVWRGEFPLDGSGPTGTLDVAEVDLPWQDLPGVPAARWKVFRHDPASGSRTLLVELEPGAEPSGFFRAQSGPASEIFVLSGELWIGNERLREHGYAYLPAGVAGPAQHRSPGGGVVICWLNGV